MLPESNCYGLRCFCFDSQGAVVWWGEDGGWDDGCHYLPLVAHFSGLLPSLWTTFWGTGGDRCISNICNKTKQVPSMVESLGCQPGLIHPDLLIMVVPPNGDNLILKWYPPRSNSLGPRALFAQGWQHNKKLGANIDERKQQNTEVPTGCNPWLSFVSNPQGRSERMVEYDRICRIE